LKLLFSRLSISVLSYAFNSGTISKCIIYSYICQLHNTRNEFVSELETILNVLEGSLKSDSELATFSEWDSLAMFSVFSLLKKMEIPISFIQIDNFRTVNDIIELAQSKLN
jgi:acyl carrier protein